MKAFKKHLRIAIASIFLSIGHWIDCRDIEDFEAEIRRINPDFKRTK